MNRHVLILFFFLITRGNLFSTENYVSKTNDIASFLAELKNSSESSLASESLPQELQDLINKTWENIVKSNEVAYHTLVTKNYFEKHYCKDECRCIAQELSCSLQEHFPEAYVVKIYMEAKKPGLIKAYVGKEPRKETYQTWLYHIVTALSFGNETDWLFIDPLVFHDIALHPQEEWNKRFEHNSERPIEYSTSPMNGSCINKIEPSFFKVLKDYFDSFEIKQRKPLKVDF